MTGFAPLAAGQRVTAGTLNALLMIGATTFYAECNTATNIPTRTTEQIGDAIAWDNAPVTDLLGAWSSGLPTRWTCTVAGRWAISGSIGFSGSSAGTLREAIWYKNGGLLGAGRAVATATSTIAATALTAEARSLTITLAVNDYVELVPLQNTGSNLAIATGSLRPFMSATYAGP